MERTNRRWSYCERCHHGREQHDNVSLCLASSQKSKEVNIRTHVIMQDVMCHRN